MLQAWCTYVCNNGRFWSHSATKSGNWHMKGYWGYLGYLHAKADSDHNILWSWILLWKTGGVRKNVDFGSRNLCVHWLTCCAISASAKLLASFGLASAIRHLELLLKIGLHACFMPLLPDQCFVMVLCLFVTNCFFVKQLNGLSFFWQRDYS